MKYIVYKTTNLINGFIYIGVHHTNTPYQFDMYLANGIYINKPDSYKKCKTAMQKAVSEFGVKNFRRETLAVFDTPEEAYDLEGELVNEEFLSRPDVYNMILGGRINHSDGIKCYQYTIDGVFLKEYKSYEEAANDINIDPTSIRRSILYKYLVNNKYYYSNQKVDVLDTKVYSKGLKKSVHRYLDNGKYDSSYDSYSSAAIATGCNYNTVARSVKLGVITEKGYYFSTVKEDSYDKARSKEIYFRPVYKYSENGEFLKEYETQHQAELDNPFSNITNSIKFKTVDANGFMWCLDKVKEYNKKSNGKRGRKVAELDNNGNIINTWNSARACCRERGSGVQNVLNGCYPTHKGIIYKYIDN